MDCSEARLDGIEAQRSMGLTPVKRIPRYSPMHLINKGARIFTSQCFSRSEGEAKLPPPKGDTESMPEFLTNLRLSDLYDLPGEYVEMNPEIFTAMRSGNEEFLKKMKSFTTPMACFKNDKGDSILHLAAAWGHLDLVKDIVSECPSLLLEPNWKDQIPLHVAARAGHSAVVEVLVASATYLSSRLSEEDREGLNIYVLKDKNGDTALHLAFEDLLEKTELSMSEHRMSNRRSLSDVIMRRSSKSISFSDASTPLMGTAAYLVNANQHASFLENKDGISPLYLAVAGNVSLVNAMLKFPDENVQDRTSDLASRLEGKKSIVHAALKAKNTDVLDVILNEDPSLVNERDEEGRTCLSVGAAAGFYEGICKLLDRSTSTVYECDDDGSFPIHRAVQNGHRDIAEELLKRCPDSECLVNKKGQNMLHIAAKSGKGRLFLKGYIKKLDSLKKKNYLIEEKDVDGNTPLHLATINWLPRTVFGITLHASSEKKMLNIQNKDGLRALDIAELRLQSEYVFRERMTLMVLLCVYKPEGVGLISTSGMTLRSRSEHLDANKYKDHINALLLVATLVSTVTFAAGFTIPGGFNSSAPNLGMAILAKDQHLSVFLFFDAVAMQSSVIAIVALIWAQLGDPTIVHKAFHLALPSLLIALFSMSWAFLYGILTIMKPNHVLTYLVTFLFAIFYQIMTILLLPYVVPQIPGIRSLDCTIFCLGLCLIFVNEDDDANRYTSGSGHMFVKRVESVGSSSDGHLQKLERERASEIPTSIYLT